MRRVLRTVLPALVLIGLVHQGGCSLFHDDYPDDRCEQDRDCFQEQGETCNQETKRCEVSSVDAGS